LGATICTPRSPACGICPWREPCAGRAAGIAAGLPARAAKAPKPVRHGWVYVAQDAGGRVLTVTRPDRGLLGGMRALPSSDWAPILPDPGPPMPAAWQAAGEVRHTFTHFHLVLRVMAARVTGFAGAPGLPVAAPEAARAMPTVFAKALRLGLGGAGVANGA
ncbi:MAG: NUDIX domain-containing protein, partial [Thermohalobaculum sp.]|nr:NUDIX domain-containing protein [Thermohalobaculum sp.]